MLPLPRLPPSEKEVSPASRLRELIKRRQTRSGRLKADGFLHPPAYDERIFLNNRDEAVAFVQRQVRNARSRIIFVDPYFNHIDVREFALTTQSEDVTVSVLTEGGDYLCRNVEQDNGTSSLAGDVFLTDIAELSAYLDSIRRKSPEIRLMGDRARSYHDRFLVIDDDVWHFGHSFNQVGGPLVCAASRLRQADEIIELIEEDLGRAEALQDAWPEIKGRRGSPNRWVQLLLDIRDAFSRFKRASK
jgi:hypothetical protein